MYGYSKHTRRQSKEARRRHTFKLILIALSATLLMCSIIGGTLAWLITETAPVKNVFTYGDIDITLKETTGERYKMVPGKTLAKDPTVTVTAESEDCWLFVKIEESTDAKLDDFVTYSVAEGWTALEGVDGVYYREVDNSDADVSFGVLAENQVVVKESVTKEMLSGLTDAKYPTMTFTAYAVQRDADIAAIDTAAEAWALVK